MSSRSREFVSRCLLAAVAALGLAGCSTMTAPFDTWLPYISQVGVYKIDINQGNYLSQDMVDRLRVGQTKAQVRQLLGTPLVASAFRDSRWDYVYEFTHQGRVVAHRTFTTYFVDDKLARWEGDEMPASQADLNREALARTASEAQWAEQRSWWDSIIDIFRN